MPPKKTNSRKIASKDESTKSAKRARVSSIRDSSTIDAPSSSPSSRTEAANVRIGSNHHARRDAAAVIESALMAEEEDYELRSNFQSELPITPLVVPINTSPSVEFIELQARVSILEKALETVMPELLSLRALRDDVSKLQKENEDLSAIVHKKTATTISQKEKDSISQFWEKLVFVDLKPFGERSTEEKMSLSVQVGRIGRDLEAIELVSEQTYEDVVFIRACESAGIDFKSAKVSGVRKYWSNLETAAIRESYRGNAFHTFARTHFEEATRRRRAQKRKLHGLLHAAAVA